MDVVKYFIILLILTLVAQSRQSWAQNETCAGSLPSCTGLPVHYPAGTSGSAEPGANYGCLSTQPAPAWFHMAVENPGNITLYMFSTPLVDIDFICWGPFADPFDPCVTGLGSGNTVDCSYSPNPAEFCDIPDALPGQYYILMITNYSQQPTEISFEQSSGSGTLDCDLVTGLTPCCTSISDIQKIKIFPNPAKNILFIDCSFLKQVPELIEFFSLSAMNIFQTSFVNENKEVISINLNDLPSGIYFLRIIFKENVINRLIYVYGK